MRDLEDFLEVNQSLVVALRHPDASVRMRALDWATEELDDELAEEMLRLLREDPSEDVRARVPIALGPTLEACDEELDEDGYVAPWGCPNEAPLSQEVYDRLVETLRRLYLDAATPAPVRRKVLEGAVRSPQPWQARAAAAAFRSGDEAWRITAVFCMGELEGFEDEIAEAFRTGSEAVRFEAIRAAGRAGVKRLGLPLKHLAESSRADVDERVAAVEALAELELPGTYDLLDDLSLDFEPAVAEAAEEALDEIGLWTLSHAAFDDDEDDLRFAGDAPNYDRRRKMLRRPTGSRPTVQSSPAPLSGKEDAASRRSKITAFPLSRSRRRDY